MSTIIQVTGRKFQVPSTPYMIQGDVASATFEFQVTETEVDLSGSTVSFFLKYRSDQNRAEMVALTKLGTTSAGAIRLQWVPDINFTSCRGNIDIQLMARSTESSLTTVWNTQFTTVFLYDDVMFNSAGAVNPQTPYLFIQYLGYVEVARDAAIAAKNTAVESAEDAEESATAAATSATNAATSEANAEDSAEAAEGYKDTASSKATEASGSATTASQKASDSEAYAIGTRGGVPVESTDPAYHNNSRYYSETITANDRLALNCFERLVLDFE